MISVPDDESGRGRGDAGQVGGIEVLPFGLLLFVVASLVVANAWAVIDAKATVDSAARAGVRAAVEAPDPATAAARADAAARHVLERSGRADDATVDVEAVEGFARCAPVTVRATVHVPTVHVPWLGGVGGGFDVTEQHGGIVDPYRSGLPGSAAC